MTYCDSGKASAAAIVALVLFGGRAAVAQSDTEGWRPQTYEGHYTGAIMPTPQRVEYTEDFWTVSASGEAEAAVVVAPEASSAERIAAAEIAARIAYLGGGQTPIVGPHEEGDAAPVIVVGMPSSSTLVAELLAEGPGVPEQSEGYAIQTAERHGKVYVLCAGRDEAGAYFAAQTLVQLFRREGDRVELQRVEVEDWPEFSVRSFKVGGSWQSKPGQPSATEEMGLWAPLAKFNCYNMCYTTLGADKWVKPDQGYIEHVQRMTRYQRARGLDCMPFVNPYYLWKEHIQVSDPEDLKALAATCAISLEAGGRKVMLCLDDFASKPQWQGEKLYTVYCEQDREQFEDDLAKVDAHMIAELHRRLREAHPESTLFAVLPYYWSPGGSWKAEGERYLQEVGKAIPEDVVVVWTGPRVRSVRIGPQDVEYYQGLIGRKCFLWDNTMYARHSPSHFFLDDFVTEYPDGLSDLCWGGVHLNAGPGEAYKAGLLAVADYLWHPDGYEPERAMRQALAMVAGPASVEKLLRFRDAFYDVYDTYRPLWGTPEQLLARVKKLEARPMEESEIDAIAQSVTMLGDLAGELAEECPNECLVAEVETRARQYAGYLEAFQVLRGLPAPEETDEANLVPNGSCAEVVEGRLVGWSTYSGAGQCRLALSEEAHTGKRAVKLATTEWHEWGGGRRSINCALIAGPSNGYTGTQAPEVEPFTRYHYSFWVKGDWPEVAVEFVGWAGDGRSSNQRVVCPTRPGSFAPGEEWTRCKGWFVTGATVRRGVLKLGISLFEDEGAKLGTIWVDDVYVGRSATPPESIEEPEAKSTPEQPPPPDAQPAGDKPEEPAKTPEAPEAGAREADPDAEVEPPVAEETP